MSKMEKFFAAIGGFHYKKTANNIVAASMILFLLLFFPFIGPLVFIQTVAPKWSIEAENGFVAFYTLIIQIPSIISFLYILHLYK